MIGSCHFAQFSLTPTMLTGIYMMFLFLRFVFAMSFEQRGFVLVLQAILLALACVPINQLLLHFVLSLLFLDPPNKSFLSVLQCLYRRKYSPREATWQVVERPGTPDHGPGSMDRNRQMDLPARFRLLGKLLKRT